MSELKWRMFDARHDYKEVCEWWKKRKWAPVPLEYLPPAGIMIIDENKKYCAAWLYVSGKMGWFEWLVTNPGGGVKKNKEAIDMIIKVVLEVAPTFGVKRIFTSLKHKKLEKIYAKAGYKVTDNNVTHLIAEVK